MAPLTRCRASSNGLATALMKDYYVQRASAGLLVSEGTWISPRAKGYVCTPGICNDAQVRAWRDVVRGVHDAGGRIFCQLWHVGCVSHPMMQPNGGTPVSSSTIRLPGEIRTDEGKFPYVTSRALEEAEIPEVVAEFAEAATRAMEAGFDGVEIHGANDYLIDQFTKDSLNTRDDGYGGSIDNRVRFGVEVCQAVTEAIGGERVGLRLSPTGSLAVPADTQPVQTYGRLVERIADLDMAYLHLVERFPGRTGEDSRQEEVTRHLREVFPGKMILNGGYTPETAEHVIASGLADAVSFGRLFISNPDLPVRVECGAALCEADASTFYTRGVRGYTDYPNLDMETDGVGAS